MGVLRMRFLAGFLFATFVGCVSAQSQHSPQRPQIELEKKSESAANSKAMVAPNAKLACNSSSATPIVVSCIPASLSRPEEEQSHEQGNESWPAFFGYRVKVTDSLLVLFTFLLWLATRNLVKGAEKTSERQLRAYVFPEAYIICAANEAGEIVEPQQVIAVGFRPVSVVRFKNTGQTPAYGVTIFGRMEIVDWSLVEGALPEIDFTKSDVSRTSLGPGAATTKFEINERNLTTEDMAVLQSGKKAIFVYGEVRYQDIFKKIRFTKYRMFIGGPVGIRSIALSSHERGNEADEGEHFQS